MIRVHLATLALAALAVQAPSQTIEVNKDNRTIAITTTDEAEAVADRAKVSVGFRIYGVDQDQTYADATKLSNGITKALQDFGIKDEAIESNEQDLSAIEDTDKARYSKGIRFQFSQGWTVSVPAASAADVLHLAITAGANSSGNISWELEDSRSVEAQATEKAMAHAMEIAERMAKGMKATLGPLVYASNQTPPRRLFGYAVNAESASRSSVVRKNLKPLAIRPDKISKPATVYAVFSLQ